MRSHKFGLAGALCVGMLLCLPATVYGAPVAETSLVVRPPMEVGEHFDAHELVKRVNLKGFFKILLGFTLTGLVCYSPAAFAIVPVNPVAWACGIIAMYTLAMTVSGRFRTLGAPGGNAGNAGNGRRDEIAQFAFEAMHEHHYPALDSMPTIDQLVGNYTNEPLLALSCLHPGQPDCFDVYYHHITLPDNHKLLHHLSLRPGGHGRNNRRDTPEQDQGVTDAQDGTQVFATYAWYDWNKPDEIAMGYDGAFPDNVANLVATNPDFTNPGVTCIDFVDADQGNQVATVGYVAIQQDQPYVDPDDELSYLSTCKQLAFPNGYIGQ